MRNLASLIVAAALALTVSGVAHAQDEPGKLAGGIVVATLDSIQLDTGYLALVKHRKDFEAKKALVDAKAKTMVDAAKPIADRIKAIQKQMGDPISDDAKRALAVEYESLLKQVREKDKEVKDYVNGQYQVLAQQGQEEKKKLLAHVRTVIAGLAKERGISLVLEHSSVDNRAQVLWYSDPAMDITGDVLAILNAGIGAVEEPAP